MNRFVEMLGSLLILVFAVAGLVPVLWLLAYGLGWMVGTVWQ